MDEEIQSSQVEEIAQPQQPEAPAHNQAPPTENDQDRNWKEMRKNYEQLRRENEEMRSHLQQMAKPQAEEDDALAPDDLPEWRHVQKGFEQIQQRLNSYEAQSIESRLRSQYNDFDSVVTEENIKKLSQTEPEMAASLLSGNDLYKKGVSAYKLIKSMVLQEDKYASQKEKIAENQSKPLGSSAAGSASNSSPLHQANMFANGLTPELKRSLMAEMQNARKGL